MDSTTIRTSLPLSMLFSARSSLHNCHRPSKSGHIPWPSISSISMVLFCHRSHEGYAFAPVCMCAVVPLIRPCASALYPCIPVLVCLPPLLNYPCLFVQKKRFTIAFPAVPRTPPLPLSQHSSFSPASSSSPTFLFQSVCLTPDVQMFYFPAPDRYDFPPLHPIEDVNPTTMCRYRESQFVKKMSELTGELALKYFRTPGLRLGNTWGPTLLPNAKTGDSAPAHVLRSWRLATGASQKQMTVLIAPTNLGFGHVLLDDV